MSGGGQRPVSGGWLDAHGTTERRRASTRGRDEMRSTVLALLLVTGLTISADPARAGRAGEPEGDPSVSPEAAAAGWSYAAPMSTARTGLAAATGADGRIYAIGGSNG